MCVVFAMRFTLNYSYYAEQFLRYYFRSDFTYLIQSYAVMFLQYFVEPWNYRFVSHAMGEVSSSVHRELMINWLTINHLETADWLTKVFSFISLYQPVPREHFHVTWQDTCVHVWLMKFHKVENLMFLWYMPSHFDG